MTTCHDIQLWWELPSIAHFCSLFRAAFGLLDFDIEDLEEAILTDGLDGTSSPLLVELLVRLLQGCLPGRSVTAANVDSCLRKLFRQKCQEDRHCMNLFPEGDFRSLSLRRKVEILQTLCDFRLEADDVVDLLKNLETESLRVEPLGFDDNGSTYWYFYGTRLYREDHSHYHPFRRKCKDDKRKHRRKRHSSSDFESESHGIWQVECFTEEDWSKLAHRFEGCESRLEKQLLLTLKEDFLPEIPRLFEEKEKRRLMEFAPRRTSGRVQKLKERKEEEEKRLAEVVTKGQHDGAEAEAMMKLGSPSAHIDEHLLGGSETKDFSIDKKKRKKLEELDWRSTEREEDVLQERNLFSHTSYEESLHKRKPGKHKDNKTHHKKHHRKKTKEHLVDETLSVSDTSNKENNCHDALSEADEASDPTGDASKQKVFIGRKTNNSLSSVAFSLTPSTVVPDSTPHIVHSQPTKKKVKSAQMLLQTEDELRTGMYKVLEHLSSHEDAWPFKDKVDESFAPNYYVVIRRPMYICKMEQRLDSGHYTSLSMFEADFKLMMDNCKLYNGPESEYTHMAYTLEKFFAKLKSKYLETEFSSDEEICIDMSFQQLSNRHKKKSPKQLGEATDSDKKRRGRKKKKVGRKAKALDAKVDRRTKQHRNRTKKVVVTEESDGVSISDGEPDLFQDYSTDPVLIVREDPYSRATLSPPPSPPPPDFSKSPHSWRYDSPHWSRSPSPASVKSEGEDKAGKRSCASQRSKADRRDKIPKSDAKVKKSQYCEVEETRLSDSEFDSDHDVALLYYKNEEKPASPPSCLSLGHVELSSDPMANHSTKHKIESPKKKHKHRHHSKHRKRKTKASKEKQVLSVDDVFDLSDDEPVEPVDDMLATAPSRESSPHKKKAKHKTKHDKHHKHQKHKDVKEEKKVKKRQKKKKAVHNVEAMDALSDATQKTLQQADPSPTDVTMSKLVKENVMESGVSCHVEANLETEAIKLEMDYEEKVSCSTENKKWKKKLKKKHCEGGAESAKRKLKKENKSEVDDKKETMSEAKDLFKDLKDGRIKPGAIIKSKDIAKKEGQVKKETKSSTDAKVKSKQNPFGKINKQENSKLTTLIAKAKESRIGLVPNSEVGDSPKLSLGSIILSGDIGSMRHSTREPNSPEDDEKVVEKFDSPWDQQWDKDSKDESSQFGAQSADEEEDGEMRDEIEQVVDESPDNIAEELIPPPPTPKVPEQDKATPNLSAWFRAFGGPKQKKASGSDDEEYDDESREEGLEDDKLSTSRDTSPLELEPLKVHSPDSIPEEAPPSIRAPTRNSSPDIAISPGKPPDTPWYSKIDEKPEEEPIWKKNKSDEDEDPYKFEEEELDRAREEAKKLEVERQRRASVSSSGLSDPSPLNIDSDRSPAFSSEGERSPMTRSPATRSPLTPGFGNTISPVTEKSPVPAFSPRYDSAISKAFYESDKGKYQANGALKIGFYQDINDKSKDKSESKDSPIYSPTVPYVSPFYNKDAGLAKQKSPGRFNSFYTSIDSSMDKPKTPAYYPASAPSTPSDRPSPASNTTDDKQKSQYNYYNYDPTKSLTDQYKNTGSSSKAYYDSNERSPATAAVVSTPGHASSLASPVLPSNIKSNMATEKNDLQPPKKRSLIHRANQPIGTPSPQNRLAKSWDEKIDDDIATANSNGPFMPMPATLANLTQIVSRIPEPCSDSGASDKNISHRLVDNLHNHHISSSASTSSKNGGNAHDAYNSTADVHHSMNSRPVRSSQDLSPGSDLSVHHQQIGQSQINSHLLSKDFASLPVGDHLSHLQPPVAHQKISDSERPGSRNIPPQAHSSEKAISYLHQKTMWTPSLPCSIASSLASTLSSFASNATMASFALAGQKGFASISSEQLAHFDRATLASLAGRPSHSSSSNPFSHELVSRNSSQTPNNATASTNAPQTATSQGSCHSRANSSSVAQANSNGANGSGNFDLGLARSYANMINAVSESSPLFCRSDAALSRSLSGSSSPFLAQSPSLGASLGMSTSNRTPTPAHQPSSLNQANFSSSIGRDPISHTHPSLQISALNSISNGQAQGLGHLNANLGYPTRDSLALMNQGGRGGLVPSAPLDPAHQQFYQQYFRQQQQLAQEELLLRSAGMGSPQLAAHQSMMLQQGLMTAAGYPSGYPHTLGLRSGTYQGMTRPWI